ncbi:hypothetical protein GCM10010371_24450 [Streptomyces subrutilus]|uniref:Uncharacterized protein n=2 Tax=Streptomyces subrutilus TaxID=36818 RepID=A0A918V391_9ACTN|nr:hypothetical protein GCM10010371_24450 [Streptomyces subrutilus]
MRAGMTAKRELLTSLRTARQLRRVRTHYTAGALLWATAAAWTGWLNPGGRQMWVCTLLLALFTVLLATAAHQLRRLPPTTPPTHHAAPRRPLAPRQANA